jgi:hypothetical protein
MGNYWIKELRKEETETGDGDASDKESRQSLLVRGRFKCRTCLDPIPARPGYAVDPDGADC